MTQTAVPGTLFQGPGPGWVDKCVPNFTPLTNNIQACGWLLLKGQALASPRSATTKRDPRSPPWTAAHQASLLYYTLPSGV